MNDDFFAGLEHFRDELRTPRRSGMAAVMTAAGSAAFESLTATVTTAAIGASASVAAAERPLETGAWVAADTRRIARIVFARSRWPVASAGSAGFAGKQQLGFLRDACFSDGFARGSGNHLGFGVNLLDFERLPRGLHFRAVLLLFGFGVVELNFVFFLSCFVQVEVLAQGGGMFGALLSDIRGEVSATRGAVGFDLRDIFRGETGSGFSVSLFHRFSFFYGLGFFFRIFLFEDGAANDRVSLGFRGSFFVLGFHEIGRESSDLIVV